MRARLETPFFAPEPQLSGRKKFFPRLLYPSTVLPLLLFAACLAASGTRCEAKAAYLAVARSAPPEEAQGKESGRELIFKIINFALLVGALGFLLRKPMAGFFLQRSASIQKSLEEGRKALEASEAQLHQVEEKLGRLEEEIRAFRDSATREMQEERQRLRQAAAGEAEKILEAARAQVEMAMRASILELRRYAAQEALKLAEGLIRERLNAASRSRLVSWFVEELTVSR